MLAPPNTPQPLQMSEAEYLVFEEQQEIKHEFVAGQVFAMAGASFKHNLIVNNVAATLLTQLAKTNGLVPSGDTRVRVNSKVSYRYPDVVVICGTVEYVENRVDTISNPLLIVEVLSPGTALVDRNQKLDEYTRIPSLQEYVLISQDEYKMERFLRQAGNDWLYTRVNGLDAQLELASVACELAASTVYAKVSLVGDDPKTTPE